MWRERLKRLAIIVGIAALTVGLASAFLKWREAKKVAGESIELPTEVIGNKIEQLGEDVLGKAVEVLPGKEKVVEKETSKTEIQTTETTKILETQTKEIIEILKQLPEEQLKQIRRQIFKDFCQEVMGD